MKVRELMHRPVHTAEASELAEEAFVRMQDKGVRHLVVLAEGEVLGVLSDRDLGGERGRMARVGQAVGELVKGTPVIAHPELEVQDAAALLEGCRIGCLPIVERGELIGIVTRSDLLSLLSTQ
jgi:acetoin utilization protein AcuB